MQYDEDPLLEGRCYNLSYSLKKCLFIQHESTESRKNIENTNFTCFIRQE
jgi:hypothetical protein